MFVLTLKNQMQKCGICDYNFKGHSVFLPNIELNHDVFVELLQPLMEDVEVNIDIQEEDNTSQYSPIQKESKVDDYE